MKAFFLAISSALAMGTGYASGLTYLSCTYPAKDGKSLTHDYTIDEANSTISMYTEDADGAKTYHAVIGSNSVTWAVKDKYDFSFTGTISRVDLSYTDEVTFLGETNKHSGKCQIKAPSERKF